MAYAFGRVKTGVAVPAVTIAGLPLQSKITWLSDPGSTEEMLGVSVSQPFVTTGRAGVGGIAGNLCVNRVMTA